MDLVVFELGLTGDFGNTQLRQQIRPLIDLQVEAFRPHLYVEDNPAGSLFMEVQDLNGKTIAASNTVAISSITSATYFHGYVKFDISIGLRKDVSYNIALKPSGYTYSASTFVGWCNDFDLRKVDTTVPSPIGVSSPLDMEIWTEQQIKRGDKI